jgi:hypothetical protein
MASQTKKYSFTEDEFLYISEHRSMVEWHRSLINRYIQLKVYKRCAVNPEGMEIVMNAGGDGIEVTPVPKTAPTEPVADAAPAESPTK